MGARGKNGRRDYAWPGDSGLPFMLGKWSFRSCSHDFSYGVSHGIPVSATYAAVQRSTPVYPSWSEPALLVTPRESLVTCWDCYAKVIDAEKRRIARYSLLQHAEVTLGYLHALHCNPLITTNLSARSDTAKALHPFPTSCNMTWTSRISSKLRCRYVQILRLALIVLHKLPDHQIKHYIFGATTISWSALIHNITNNTSTHGILTPLTSLHMRSAISPCPVLVKPLPPNSSTLQSAHSFRTMPE